jgi:hypothetical protein
VSETETMTPQVSSHHARRVVRRLLHADRPIRDDLRRDILSLGDAAVPALLEIMEDDDLALSKSPGGGWAPAHAVRLLGELKAAGAVEPMLRLLATTDYLDVLHDQLIQSLPEIGTPVIEPALRAYAENDNTDFRFSLCAVLAEAGVRDDRIFEILIDQLRADSSRAGNLAIYGDERAVPHLHEALDRYELVESESPLANHTLIELRAAIEDLGGTLTAEQQRKCRRGREPAEVFRRKMDALLEARRRDIRRLDPIRIESRPPEPIRRRERPGRNDPCWCGSAKKYKKCHLAADESGSSTHGDARS